MSNVNVDICQTSHFVSLCFFIVHIDNLHYVFVALNFLNLITYYNIKY